MSRSRCDDCVIQVGPLNTQSLLQLVRVDDTMSVYVFLQYAPYAVIYRI